MQCNHGKDFIRDFCYQCYMVGLKSQQEVDSYEEFQSDIEISKWQEDQKGLNTYDRSSR